MHDVSLTLVDTTLLAPAGHQSLDDLGSMLGVPKNELPEGYDKGKMTAFMQSHPELFESYALRDAEITARWAHRMICFQIDVLGIGPKPAPTLASMAVRLFIKMSREQGGDLDNLLGRKVLHEGRKRRRVFLPELADRLSLIASCYLGGRNEAFVLGESDGRLLYDLDIKGAYTTAMAAIRVPNWCNARETICLDDLAVIDEAMTFARVRFKFPDDTSFPCLPVRAGDRGLIFPLEGETYATGPELFAAWAMGAYIYPLSGVIVPWQQDDRPFLDFTRQIAELRFHHEKGSPIERAAKEIGNSLYGKVAQAVSGMRPNGLRARVFDTRDGEFKNLPPSQITQPALAAYTTGLVRALGTELLSRLPQDAYVANYITDGFMSSVPLGEVARSSILSV